jgi:hypothetical protein
LAGIATGGVSSRYLTDDLTLEINLNSRVGGHPWARATLGKPGDKNIRRHNQAVFLSCGKIINICPDCEKFADETGKN